jgi:hypothetical protein
MKTTVIILAAAINAAAASAQKAEADFCVALTNILYLSDSAVFFKKPSHRIAPSHEGFAFVLAEARGENYEATIDDEQAEVIRPERIADALQNWKILTACGGDCFFGKRIDGRRYLFRPFEAKD